MKSVNQLDGKYVNTFTSSSRSHAGTIPLKGNGLVKVWALALPSPAAVVSDIWICRYQLGQLKEIMIHLSFPQRQESIFYNAVDSRLRGNDSRELRVFEHQKPLA